MSMNITEVKPREYTKKDKINAKHETLVKGFDSGKTLDLEFRKEQLRNLYYAIKDNEQLLKDALIKDFHRSPFETEFLELHGVYSEINLAITNLDKWAADESLGFDIRMMMARPVLRRQPYGSVLIFGPWNYPYLCAIVPVVSAIAAGNTVLLKPTEMAPYSTEVVATILERALHPSIFQCVTGAVEESTALLELKWDKIMVTGSSNVGKIVATAAAKDLTPVVLELGGKSPAIVSRDANIKLAARRIAWGKFSNSGQTCIAPDYVIIDDEVKEKFIAELVKALKTSYPNLDKDTEDWTHIATDRLWDRANKLIETTKGKVEFQWGKADKASKFYPPTVVSGVELDDCLMGEEIFAPLLPILSVSDVNTQALPIVRQHDYPLAAYFFTTNSKRADELLSRIRSGAAVVNDCIVQGGSAAIPFGGIKNSGTGRYHGKFGFDEFSHARPLLRQPNFIEALLHGRYAPYRASNLKNLRFLGVPSEWFPRSGPVRRGLLSRLLNSRKVQVLVLIFVALFLKSRV